VESFLKPFEELTELVSTTGPNLSLVPLMKLRVKKLCFVRETDDTVVKKLKKLVLNGVDDRLQETEACSVAQILNLNTKMLHTKSAALDVLRPVIDQLMQRQLIAVAPNHSFDEQNQGSSATTSGGISDGADTVTKRSRHTGCGIGSPTLAVRRLAETPSDIQTVATYFHGHGRHPESILPHSGGAH